ncbi:MAG TPA: MtrB/PioB family outer membrane beta-barrel protein, partial [Vicinamibacteria bacterium]|nr:MtrB/PioB family outer membrane beta-barrel protein [Vicinamibacteria bacterium]
MKRALKFDALLGLVLLTAAPMAMAQNAPFGLGTDNCATRSEATRGGQVSVGVLGASDVDSSKFTEYRDVPEGVSAPCFNLFSKSDTLDVNLFGYNVRQDDQRYQGWLNTKAFDLSFDYNQIPHDMGNNGRTIQAELSEGVWGMSDTLQQSLGTTVNATPTAGRTTPFYDALLAPTFAAAGSVDISSVRKRGTATFDLGKKLPFGLAFTYMRELKSGFRGEDGGGLYSAINSVVELPSPLNEITQDIGVRAAYDFPKGNIHGSFVRNLYNNRAETMTVDNPFQWFDTPYVATPAPAVGGGSRARFINAPDNEASTGNLGFLLKLAKQTRIGGDFSLGQWTQDAPFYPHTINAATVTPSGARADSVATLPQSSFDGKIDTTTLNFTLSSRPAEHLAVRAQFRRYELENKTDRFVITGDVATNPDRSWTVNTPTANDPYGHATANVYDSKTSRFTAAAAYDVGALTLEGLYRNASIERTSREAHSGDDEGFAFTAVYRAKDWMDLRATYDEAKRTAEGETIYGFQSDEAERETKRTGVNVDFTLPKGFELGFAYFRR